MMDREVWMQHRVLTVSACILVLGAAARADPPAPAASVRGESLAALRGALEIGIGLSYSQGLGNVGDGLPSLTDTGGAGESVEVDLGWRVSPKLLLGAYGTGAKFITADASDGADVWSATAGVHANWHFLPGQGLDPWVGLGAGWRGYWVARSEGTSGLHGLDISRVQVGVDGLVTAGIAIAPFLGVTASYFLARQGPQEASSSRIQNPKVDLFFNAGLMGRFDFFGG